MRRAALVKAGALVVVVLVAVGVALAFGTPDVPAMRARIDAAGSFGPILFLVVYAGLALIPVPKAVLTAAGGVLFGLWAGAGLSLAGALVAAVISFGVGRLLGREAVDRLIRGRMARVDSLLAGNGFSTVLVVRLVPLVPFTAINTPRDCQESGSATIWWAARSGWCRAALPMQPWGLTAPTRGVWSLPAPPWSFSSSAGRGGRGGWTRAAWTTPQRTAPMLDAAGRRMMDRPLSELAGLLDRSWVTPNRLTLLGLATGQRRDRCGRTVVVVAGSVAAFACDGWPRRLPRAQAPPC